MEFQEKNSAGKFEIWRVEDGVRRKVIIVSLGRMQKCKNSCK